MVKAAYAAMAKKYHPDKGGTAERMKEINEAYEVLSDLSKKARYDEACRRKQATSGAASGSHYQSGAYRSQSTSSTGSSSRHSSSSYQSYQSYHRQSQSSRYQQATRAPPAKEKLLPWPSWQWQRIALFASLAIALILLLLVHHVATTVIGLLMLAAASYACVTTRCLNKARQTSIPARLAGGFAIVLGLCGMGLVAICLAVPVMLLLLLLPVGKA